MKKQLIIILLLIGFYSSKAQTNFPDLINANIPGAPILGKPFLVMGDKKPVMAEKHGLAAPLLYDWNHDGKKDLLIGEFETSDTGSTIRVYLNSGSNAHPKFSDKYEYAKTTTGINMAIPQWCCIGFTPQLVDLDQDGYPDILTGQYSPGEITWFRGSKQGFLPGVKLNQTGIADAKFLLFSYFSYSSATFGDMDGDGLTDLIVGGFGGLRWAKNIGTKAKPQFGVRQSLLDVEGKRLDVRLYTHADSVKMAGWKFGKLSVSGDGHVSPVCIDWDQDGVMDLLVTNSFRNEQLPVVTFFKGVKTNSGIRFRTGIPLFKAANNKKPFPGSGPRVTVGDWNGDGVPDLIIGTSVPTIDGVFNDHLSWTYEDVTGIQAAGKDPGEVPVANRQKVLDMIAKDSAARKVYLGTEGKPEYLGIRHQGYVYVLLGKKNPVKAVQETVSSIPSLSQAMVTTKKTENEIVNYTISYPKEIIGDEAIKVKIDFDIAEGWHIYSPTSVNNKQGMIPVTISFKGPMAWNVIGEVEMPKPHILGLTEVFEGEHIEMIQNIDVPRIKQNNEYKIIVHIGYQACDKEKCLPPQDDVVELTILGRPEVVMKSAK